MPSPVSFLELYLQRHAPRLDSASRLPDWLKSALWAFAGAALTVLLVLGWPWLPLGSLSAVVLVILALCGGACGWLLVRVLELRMQLGHERERNDLLQQFADAWMHSSGSRLEDLSADGRLLAMSASGQRAMEIDSFERLRGSDWFGVWGEAERGAAREAFGKALAGTPARFSASCATLRGNLRWWDVLLMPISRGGRVESVLSLSWDVTESQQAARRLRQANEELGVLLENLQDGFFRLDNEARFIQVNGKAEELLRRSRADLLGHCIWDRFPEAARSELRSAFQDVQLLRIPRRFETYFAAFNSWYRVSAYPRASGISVFLSNITRDVNELQTSQTAEARLRLAQEVGGYADWEFDLVKRELTLSQQALALIDGQLQDSVIDQPALLRVMHPDDRLKFVSAMLDLTEGGRSINLLVRIARHAGHSQRWGHFQCAGVVIFPQARPGGVLVGSIQDVTVQQEREAQLVEAEAFTRSILDAIPQAICVLDGQTRMLASNPAWQLDTTLAGPDALVGGLTEAGAEQAGYLDHCRRMAAAGSAPAQQMVEGLEALTEEIGEPFDFHYAAHVAEHRRFFHVSVVRVSGASRRLLVLHRDVTETARLQQALCEQLQRFQQLVEFLPHVFWVFDIRSQRLDYVSPAFARLWGRPADALFDSADSWIALVHPEDRCLAIAFHDEVIEQGRSGEVEYRSLNAAGEQLWIRNRAFPYLDADGQVERVIGIAENITEAHSYREQLYAAAHFDALTGLPNGFMFRQRVTAQCNQSPENGSFMVLVISIDRLRWVQQCLGQQTRDQLAPQIVERATAALQGRGFLASLDGDELGLLLSREEERRLCQTLIEDLIKAMATPFQADCEAIKLGAKVGVAMYSDDGNTAEMLLKNARAAAFTAQQTPDCCFSYFNKGLLEQSLDSLKLEAELERALRAEEFVVYYQPKINLRERCLSGAEALLRWRHPEHGLVSPLRFIPLLEATGLIVPVGLWCIDQSLGQLAAWRRSGLEGFTVAVNLSIKQIQPSLITEVADALARHGIEPQYLELELTESMMHEEHRLSEVVAGLKALGVRLAVDDFGTGYSTLGSLRTLAPHTLKIDRSFLKDMAVLASDQAIVQSVIDMAHALDITVVAEGVENGKQLSILERLDCDEVQGFLFSPPVDAAAFAQRFVCGELSGRWREECFVC